MSSSSGSDACAEALAWLVIGSVTLFFVFFVWGIWAKRREIIWFINQIHRMAARGILFVFRDLLVMSWEPTVDRSLVRNSIVFWLIGVPIIVVVGSLIASLMFFQILTYWLALIPSIILVLGNYYDLYFTQPTKQNGAMAPTYPVVEGEMKLMQFEGRLRYAENRLRLLLWWNRLFPKQVWRDNRWVKVRGNG